VFNKKTVNDIEVAGKTIFARVDFNVPLDNGKITDDTRIQAALPTIKYLLNNGAAVILASHLGRPGGKRDDKLSLRPVAEYLDKNLDNRVIFAADCRGGATGQLAHDLQPGEILLLENTRFYPGEKKNDPEMGKELAELADIFINDAFGTAHRAHASNVGVADYLPSAAGYLLEKEINYLGRTIADPARPFTAILGGAKVSDKIDVINNLIKIVDWILIGGGMANTFFAAQGYKMGDSLVEEESIDLAKDILSRAEGKLVLPVDLVLGDSFTPEAETRRIDLGNVADGWRIMDIGKRSLEVFAKIIIKSQTIVWNGPMGVFEFPTFAHGTNYIAKMVSESKAVSIIGGGDSAAAIAKAGLSGKITHISTGGGASLCMLEGRTLPGLDALDDK